MMRRCWSRATFILAMAVPLAGASAAAVGPSALAAPVHASAALSRGRDLPRASTAAAGENLLGVSAASATDAWAVGYKCSNAVCSEPDLTYGTLTEHWNGTTWSTVASPNPDSSDQLTGVSAVSATDAWAVGNAVSGGTFILHWNGSKWSTTPDPVAGSIYFLDGVTAISATDAWAVGEYDEVSELTLILHWNGSKWSQVASPSPTTLNQLYSVSAASATDAWAVGRDFPGSGSPYTNLTEHWNGSKWSEVASPSPGALTNALFGVSTLTPANAWAVGESEAASSELRTVVLHWNGKAWARVDSPDPGSSFSVLDGVSAVSASDAWAVGNYSSNKGSTDSTLILRWNGTKWTQVPSPSPNPNSSGVNNLAGVSTVSAESAFAAGSSDDAFTGVNLALIVDWNGTKWARP
jgi:hypothetical protein